MHNDKPRKKAVEPDNDEQRKTNSRTMASNSAQRLVADRDRSDIRVFETQICSQHYEHSEYSQRDRCEAESERLVKLARKYNLYRTTQEIKEYGERHPKSSGESVVYINAACNRIYKIKDPYAKSPMKKGVQPEDAIYEHLVHNLIFPETRYKFEGISDVLGDVRIVLSQAYIESVGQPTRTQVVDALAKKNLHPEDKYSFGNEFVSVTDVEGDNALLGKDGAIYFIDPIISFKKPINDLLREL